MVPGIDPKVDYAFKRIFGSERNRGLLIDLLNCVLHRTGDDAITDIEILNPFNEKETAADKLSVLDIKARDGRGRFINIEMQMLLHPFLSKRLLYYWSRLYTQQLGEGDAFEELQPTIVICFLNAVMYEDLPGYHRHFRLVDEATGMAYSDDLAIHIIELPKFTAAAEQLSGGLDAWLYFLRHAPVLDSEALPVSLNVPPIQKAMQELVMVTQSELERERYEARLKAQLDENSWRRALENAARDVAKAVERARQAEEHAEQVQQRAEQAEVERERAQQERERAEQELERADRELERAEQERERAERERERTERESRTEAAIRIIHICQRVRGEPLTPDETLRNLPFDDLQRLADQYEQQSAS